jgi:hypothetical protein
MPTVHCHDPDGQQQYQIEHVVKYKLLPNTVVSIQNMKNISLKVVTNEK